MRIFETTSKINELQWPLADWWFVSIALNIWGGGVGVRFIPPLRKESQVAEGTK